MPLSIAEVDNDNLADQWVDGLVSSWRRSKEPEVRALDLKQALINARGSLEFTFDYWQDTTFNFAGCQMCIEALDRRLGTLP